jgi:DNA mismatch endonuclease, patch repair protein
LADIFTKEKRSEIMASISSRETQPEITIRKGLFALGFRYRKNVKTLPGNPDIVLPKYQAVILIHGCFWHGHHCKKATRPTSNTKFWDLKIDGNIERDKKVIKQLRKSGWKVITVWECELRTLKGLDNTLKKIVQKLGAR